MPFSAYVCAPSAFVRAWLYELDDERNDERIDGDCFRKCDCENHRRLDFRRRFGISSDGVCAFQPIMPMAIAGAMVPMAIVAIVAQRRTDWISMC